ncbi:HTH_48 domain-containing protein [Trichonephila clavipes]|nr:HTH_48 domain-containing protein [Trichonephila clavipes]
MASQIPEEIHIRHCMLLEFHKSSNATVVTKNICDVHSSVLDVCKCQIWLSQSGSGNFELSDSHRPGRPTTLDNDVIKGASGSTSVRAQVEANLCQTIEELSNAFNQPWSTIQ